MTIDATPQENICALPPDESAITSKYGQAAAAATREHRIRILIFVGLDDETDLLEAFYTQRVVTLYRLITPLDR